MMIAPDIRDSSEEDRRKRGNDQWNRSANDSFSLCVVARDKG